MLSKPYPSKGTAKGAAKVHAQENGITKIALALDLEKRQYYFTDEDKAPKELITFARLELVKGKWRDKTPLGKVTCSGGAVVTEKYYQEGGGK